MINIPTIELKKVDSKGRVILPKKDLDKVFISEVSEIIIISSSEEELKKTIQTLERQEKERKIKIVTEWDKLLDDAEVTDITTEEINKATLESQQKKLAKE